MPIDERTKNLVSMGAAIGARCFPCFRHYFSKSLELGITIEEVQEVIEISRKVDNGGSLAYRDQLKTLLSGGDREEKCCEGESIEPCYCN